MVDQETTGAYDSATIVNRSPRTQMRAFFLMISPEGLRLILNTQVQGMTFCPFYLASDF